VVTVFNRQRAGESGLIFTNERDAPIQQHRFAVVWASAARRAGLPAWATPHDLRHYFGSVLIRSGA
jgi:site-specific recombinase XerD